MGKSQFRIRMEGSAAVVEVWGPLDEEAAADLVKLAGAAASTGNAVEIDLDEAESMTPEAAALLLFRGAPWRANPGKITLRASGQPGRQTVLRAYARRRARPETA